MNLLRIAILLTAGAVLAATIVSTRAAPVPDLTPYLAAHEAIHGR